MSSAHVTVTYNGTTSSFVMSLDGRTIVEAADEEAIELPSQCRAGICGTCRGRLVSGEVVMRDSSALDTEELAAGWVLACQSVPRTAQVVLEFCDQ